MQFRDVAVGTVFVLDNKSYTKCELTKISCCKKINAVSVDDPKDRIKVDEKTEVVVDEQQ